MRKTLAAVVLALRASTSGALVRSAHTKELSPAPAPAPAPSPLGSPAGPQLETLGIDFTISNFNYLDLTKETCPEKIQRASEHLINKPQAPKPQPAVPDLKAPPAPQANNAGIGIEGMHKQADKVQKDIQDAVGESGSGKPPWMQGKGKHQQPVKKAAVPQEAPKDGAVADVHAAADDIQDDVQAAVGDSNGPTLPWMQGKKSAASFMQLKAPAGNQRCRVRKDLGQAKGKECTTIQDLFRDTIKKTLNGIIECLWTAEFKFSAPAPAPAPVPMGPPVPPAALLPDSPAGAPAALLQRKASAVVPPLPAPEMFVTFSPGPKVGDGYSTNVQITFLDLPGNKADDVAEAKRYLTQALADGIFDHILKDSLKQVTGFRPQLKKVSVEKHKVEQWNIEKCEQHITDIVNLFSKHYTRRQVPIALYNECTNFMTKMSFSHDFVLDPMDTKRCRRATRKFAEHWKQGKNAEKDDFQVMCFHACESKYGRNAPTCNLHAGDELLKQPKF